MSKTLVVILHHNTVQHTETLYELLKPYENNDYDLLVLDNGSDKGKESKYASWMLDQNVYFGGALDVVFRYMCEDGNDNYDSLLWMNNDLIVEGNGFVKTLRKELSDFDVLSPCIIQPEKIQNHWIQMRCHYKNNIRKVRWIDLQTPMISKKLIKYLYDNRTTTENVIDMSLLYGWGIDIYLGVVCESQGWKTGVCDYIPAVHLGSMTLKDLNNTSEYCQNAERGQYEFFQKINKINEFIEMRKWAENYTI